ncbi:MAG: hypothetical protein HC880_21295 [Bacteroidia bacterium]|nr:hypothetical protein [Bacteroidia bacterium]
MLHLKAHHKYPAFQEALEVAIQKAIRYARFEPSEIEDFFTEDYGLQGGQREASFGSFTSKIEVTDYSTVRMAWFDEEGNPQKNMPAPVKKDLPRH